MTLALVEQALLCETHNDLPRVPVEEGKCYTTTVLLCNADTVSLTDLIFTKDAITTLTDNNTQQFHEVIREQPYTQNVNYTVCSNLLYTGQHYRKNLYTGLLLLSHIFVRLPEKPRKFYLLLEFIPNGNLSLKTTKKLCYHRWTAWHTRLCHTKSCQLLHNCRNKLYSKSTTNRSNGAKGLQLIDV